MKTVRNTLMLSAAAVFALAGVPASGFDGPYPHQECRTMGSACGQGTPCRNSGSGSKKNNVISADNSGCQHKDSALCHPTPGSGGAPVICGESIWYELPDCNGMSETYPIYGTGSAGC